MKNIAKLGKPSLIFGFGQEKRLNLIKKYIDLKGKNILDVGCGIGIYSQKFLEGGAEVFGIDIDKEKIKKAREFAPKIHFLIAKAEKLPFENDFFDIVFLHEVLEHVKNDGQVISESMRVLKPGGKIIIFAPNRLFPFETHGIYFGGKYIFGNIPLVNWLPLKIRNIFCPHVRVYTPRTLKQLFALTEFEAIDFVWPAFDKVTRKFPKIGKFLKKFANFAEKNFFLKKFGISVFMIAKKGV